MKTRTLLLPLLALLAASPLHAVPAVPEIINYQGYVTNAAGAALPDGNYDIFFRIYNQAIGGTALWVEKQTVTVSGGQFSVMLGNGINVGTTNHDQLGIFLTTNAATGISSSGCRSMRSARAVRRNSRRGSNWSRIPSRTMRSSRIRPLSWRATASAPRRSRPVR